MPNTREKLIELLEKQRGYTLPVWIAPQTVEIMADVLIYNGVTVQDGKPLEAFLHPIDAYNGLKSKYLVFKADTGEKVENCFILRPDKDPAAVEALRVYARAIDNKTLAEDIYNWVGKGEPVQEWISVKDRLPDIREPVLIKYLSYIDGTANPAFVGTAVLLDENSWYWWGGDVGDCDEEVKCTITHWMPLPEPPKEV